jgi:hypothetical protein
MRASRISFHRASGLFNFHTFFSLSHPCAAFGALFVCHMQAALIGAETFNGFKSAKF